MVKLIFCVRRLDGMEPEAFHRYWLEEHGPLVRTHAEALGIRRYVQTHARVTPGSDLLRASRGAPEPYDGVAELWFDSEEALAESGGSPEGMAAAVALLEDEQRFIEHARSPLFLADEHEVIAGG